MGGVGGEGGRWGMGQEGGAAAERLQKGSRQELSVWLGDGLVTGTVKSEREVEFNSVTRSNSC